MRNKIFSIFVIAVLCGYSFAAAMAIDQDAIILALPFDEGKGKEANDISTHGNHGVLSDTARWAQGRIGMCVRLQNAYVEVANHPSLSLHNTDFTMAVWIKFTEEAGWYDLMAHSEGGGGDDKQWIWLLSGGKFKFHLHNRGVDITWIDSDFFGFPELDRWYHAALVKQGNRYTHYLDGESLGEKVNDTPISDEINNPLTIGTGPGEFFIQGFVDEAFITRQPLTQNDIRNHFSGGIEGVLSVAPSGKFSTRWGSLKTEYDR